MSMNLDPNPLYGAAYRAACHRWLWLREKTENEDFRQAVSLACIQPDFRPGNVRRPVDRMMYHLARTSGFARPSAGLPRGKSGGWADIHQEYFRRRPRHQVFG